jgi:hypothetical protein
MHSAPTESKQENGSGNLGFHAEHSLTRAPNKKITDNLLPFASSCDLSELAPTAKTRSSPQITGGVDRHEDWMGGAVAHERDAPHLRIESSTDRLFQRRTLPTLKRSILSAHFTAKNKQQVHISLLWSGFPHSCNDGSAWTFELVVWLTHLVTLRRRGIRKKREQDYPKQNRWGVT